MEVNNRSLTAKAVRDDIHVELVGRAPSPGSSDGAAKVAPFLFGGSTARALSVADDEGRS